MDSLMKKLFVILSALCIVLSIFFSPSVFAEDETPVGSTTSQEESTDSNGNNTDSKEDGSDDSNEENAMYKWQHEWELNPESNAPCPPFGGGPITGAYMEWRTGDNPHYHEGLDIGIDDAEIKAPFAGTVWHKRANDDGFGDGIVYFVSDEPFESYGILYLLFADLDTTTGDMPSEFHVEKGQTIGYVKGYTSPSTGAHVHVQYYNRDVDSHYAPYLHIENDGASGAMDPTGVLKALRVDLSGVSYSGPNAGKIGSDGNNKFAESFWTVEAMKALADAFNDIIKFWSEKAKEAIQSILPYVYYLLLVLCVFDLTLPILLAGLSFKVNSLIIKILKYSGIMAVLILWPKFLNDILINFITTVGGIVARDEPELTSDLTQPAVLFLKAISLIQPAMDKIGAFSIFDYLTNIGQVVMIYLMTFAVIGVFIYVAIKITLVYIEFYVVGGLSLVTVPFGSWSMSKFIAEGPIGHLISTALKLLIISFMVGMCTLCLRDAHADNIFDPSPVTSTSTTTPGNTTGKTDNKDSTTDKDKDKTQESSSEEVGEGEYVLKGYGKTIYTNNPLCKKIWDKANAMGVDPYIALAIAARESGGDDIEAIHFDDDYKSAGIFQITLGQSIQDPVTNKTLYIRDLFPNYQYDVDENIAAGLTMLKDKIRGANGNIWQGVKDYNGGGDPQYLQRVQTNYTKISGMPAGHIGNTGISAESLAKYCFICTVLIILATTILIIPDKLINVVKGPIQIGG